jgi:hypothetical protein
MKISVKELKRLLVEQLLSEDADQTVSEEGGDSLDNQVDKYLAQYESEAQTSKTEGTDFRMLTRRLVSEAEGDEPTEEPGDEAMGEPTKLGLDKIDVESFVDSVVRMIDNYDSLLETRNTLFRRAKGFLSKTYDDEVVKSYESLMSDQHGLGDSQSQKDHEESEFAAPPADRAGDGGGGGAGPA